MGFIDKDTFINDIIKRYCKPCEKQGADYKHTKCRACWINDMLDEIIDASTTEDEPVKYGEWIYGLYNCPHCSECRKEVTSNDVSPYCPNCGAKMDLRGEELEAELAERRTDGD